MYKAHGSHGCWFMKQIVFLKKRPPFSFKVAPTSYRNIRNAYFGSVYLLGRDFQLLQ